MRRRPGVAHIHHHQSLLSHYTDTANALSTAQTSQLHSLLTTFQSSLQTFAAAHKSHIDREPDLRLRFHEMCIAIGVDPLISRKSYWARMLGVGEFYYELGIRALDACISLRPTHGSLLPLPLLASRLSAPEQPVPPQDVVRAIALLAPLGNPPQVVELNIQGKLTKLLRTVPREVDPDYGALVRLAQQGAGVLKPERVMASLGWREERVSAMMAAFVSEGLAWVDKLSSPGKTEYYIPFYFPGLAPSSGL